MRGTRVRRGILKTLESALKPLCLAWLLATGSVHAQENPAAPAEATPVVAIGAEAKILSDKDIDLYRRIFAVQEPGDWKEADRLIAQLDNDILMGHVLYQRYMHPTKYRTPFVELRDWMDRFPDHPDADNIYRLGVKRKPSGSRAPNPPSRTTWEPPDDPTPRPPSPRLSDDEKYQQQVERSMRSAITRYLGRRGNTARAEKRL